jgi:hypothetical protein
LYFNFVLARQEADSIKADHENYILAQFEELSSFGILPAFGAFYGDKAKGRYKSFMFKKKEKASDTEIVASDKYKTALANAQLKK